MTLIGSTKKNGRDTHRGSTIHLGARSWFIEFRSSYRPPGNYSLINTCDAVLPKL